MNCQTTFLASVDGELFVLTSTPSEVTLDASLGSQELVYACFTGALIFHVCAAILGYVASFALIRYQIVDIAPADAKNAERLLRPIYPLDVVNNLFQMPLGLQVKSRTSTPPLDLLTRCYFTTLALGCRDIRNSLSRC
ncbi:hypothetical protein DEU56DRAFT_481878 [Suillus clintonianus]|uniref:uncharacterized protein n=1 Tax=Suillus clintonianus TaxID=1904413 RepID=UPI001B873177|nr:uncharacterized protein DEU56DRAFT_481878 [Suillus clintonianus]KAG2153365.1 hypothetical protein DEU56DRAFT_481878 [Suillus clintonianus]